MLPDHVRIRSMSLDYLHPFAGQHAIQSAIFALDFTSELELNELTRLKLSAAELSADFPKISDQHRATLRVQIKSGKPNSGESTAAMDAGGFVMERPSPSQIGQTPPIRFINVTRENIVIVINDYTRWAKFKADVDRYLSILLKSVNAQKGIASVGLQFTDAFAWKADPEDLDLSEVFSTKTEYLVPSVFKRGSQLWHSHHGYLLEQTKPIEFQQLDNVNISRTVVGPHQQLQLQVLTSHKATFARPLYKILDSNRMKLSQIADLLHTKNKEILADILTEAVQSKIGLSASEEE